MSDSLRKLIRELVEEELEESTSSGAAGPYNTPFAFRGNTADGKAKAKKNAENSGNTFVEKTQEKADDAGPQNNDAVSFGEKGAGALKKPKAEPKPKIEESDSASRSLEDRLKAKEEHLKRAEKSAGNPDSRVSPADAAANIKRIKSTIADLKTQIAKKSSKTEVVQENRYNEFKMQEGSPSQKIGKAIREINRQISEVDRVLRMNERLKQESGMNGEQLWKSTARGLTKLEGRMNTLSARIRNLKA